MNKNISLPPKTVAPVVKRPIAPPVYRPQPTPKVLQTKQVRPAPVLQNLALQKKVAQPLRKPPVLPPPKVPVINKSPALVKSPKPVRPVVQAKLAPSIQLKRRARGRLAMRGWYSQSGNYFVANNNKNKLYSYWGTPGPEPASLFIKGWDLSCGVLWTTWTPKVQFILPNNSNPDGWAKGEYDRAKARMGGEGTFIFGKNDCANFATVLSSLIGQETRRGASDVTLKGAVQIVPHERRGVGVGTMLKHTFVNDPSAQYHAATVVAVDGKDLITLEADVSKPMTRPEFCVRSGTWGFVRDNDPEYQFGDEVRVSQVGPQKYLEARTNNERLTNPEFSWNADAILERSLVAERS